METGIYATIAFELRVPLCTQKTLSPLCLSRLCLPSFSRRTVVSLDAPLLYKVVYNRRVTARHVRCVNTRLFVLSLPFVEISTPALIKYLSCHMREGQLPHNFSLETMTVKQNVFTLILLGLLSTKSRGVSWDNCATDKDCPDSTCEDQEPGPVDCSAITLTTNSCPAFPLDVFPTKTVTCSYKIQKARCPTLWPLKARWPFRIADLGRRPVRGTSLLPRFGCRYR
jgi:hypothetical protein